jgi:hypothetical protein
VLGALAIPAMARADGLRLRGDVTARGDVLQAGDAERRRRFDDPAGLDRSGRAERGRAEQRAGCSPS